MNSLLRCLTTPRSYLRLNRRVSYVKFELFGSPNIAKDIISGHYPLGQLQGTPLGTFSLRYKTRRFSSSSSPPSLFLPHPSLAKIRAQFSSRVPYRYQKTQKHSKTLSKRALAVHPRGSWPPAQIHLQPPPRIVDVSHGTLRGSSILLQHGTPSNRHPHPAALRGQIPSQGVRGPDRGISFRITAPRGYESFHNHGGGGTRAPDKHHNMRDKSRDSRSTLDIQLKREYQSDGKNRNNIRGRVQKLNSPRDGRAEIGDITIEFGVQTDTNLLEGYLYNDLKC